MDGVLDIRFHIVIPTFTPWMDPLFLPSGVSNTRPTHSPLANYEGKNVEK
jgi:hypothetical protein